MFLVSAFPAWAAENGDSLLEPVENVDYTVVKKEGLNFRVPIDMTIEKRNGIIAPISTDQYIYGKFKKLNERLDATDKNLTALDEKLGRVIRLLEERPLPAEES